MFSKRLTALAAIAASLLCLSGAHAATLISVGFYNPAVDAGIVTVASGADAVVFGGADGVFNINLVTGATGTNTFNTSSNNFATGAGTMNVYVTLSGITDPLGTFALLSAFTSNTLGNATVTEKTFFDSGNGLWGTTGTSQLLASQAFASPGTASATNLVDVLLAPYSVTAVYTITALGAGAFANSTINISAETPLPGTLPLIAGGLGALWMVGRKRRTRKSSVVA
jgi:hypothetical protein